MPQRIEQGGIFIEVEEQIAQVIFSSPKHDLAGILRTAANIIAQKGWQVESIDYRRTTGLTKVSFFVSAEKEVIYPTVTLDSAMKLRQVGNVTDDEVYLLDLDSDEDSDE